LTLHTKAITTCAYYTTPAMRNVRLTFPKRLLFAGGLALYWPAPENRGGRCQSYCWSCYSCSSYILFQCANTFCFSLL